MELLDGGRGREGGGEGGFLGLDFALEALDDRLSLGHGVVLALEAFEELLLLAVFGATEGCWDWIGFGDCQW